MAVSSESWCALYKVVWPRPRRSVQQVCLGRKCASFASGRLQRHLPLVMTAAKTKVRGGRDACSATNCSNSWHTCLVKSFFRFPKDETRCVNQFYLPFSLFGLHSLKQTCLFSCKQNNSSAQSLCTVDGMFFCIVFGKNFMQIYALSAHSSFGGLF